MDTAATAETPRRTCTPAALAAQSRYHNKRMEDPSYREDKRRRATAWRLANHDRYNEYANKYNLLRRQKRAEAALARKGAVVTT
jgi:hypothetical protein